MKSLFALFIFLTSIFFSVNNTEAALLDRRGGLVYDDDLDVTWLWNANFAASGSASGTMTWSGAVSWANGLVYQGYDDWRLPDSSNEMSHLYFIEGVSSGSTSSASYTGPFINVRPFMYWSGIEDSADPSRAYRFNFKTGTQGTSSKSYKRYAWAARDGDSTLAVAPEPESVILFITGAVTLGIIRRKNA